VPAPTDPAQLLARALRADPARPFVTYYDPSSGGRVELSVTTFDNWVSKTAGLLRDELEVEPGATVSVVVPAHWLGLVWAMAVWTVGARLVLVPADSAAVSVRAAGEQVAASGQVVVLNAMPMGGPAGPAVPPGALDYGREVLGYPDVFGPAETCDDPLLSSLTDRLDVTPGQRLLVAAERTDAASLRVGLLAALLADGSTVLVRSDGSGDARLHAIAADEHAELGG
jgi:uncharacterized protein (TIGR03089 family)